MGIQVFVIDNSITFQNALVQELNHRLPAGSSVGHASQPAEALKLLQSFRPTAIIMNFALGAMLVNQEKFLPLLVKTFPQVPITTYGISDNVSRTAKFLGAAHYLKKPSVGQPMDAFYNGVIQAIRSKADGQTPPRSSAASPAPRFAPRPAPRPMPMPPPVTAAAPTVSPILRIPPRSGQIDLIAIGASTGGTEAISALITPLVPPLPGIVIVQHIPPMFSRLFSERLNSECQLTIKEAADGDVVKPNHVYIAPGGKHMSITRQGSHYRIECKPGPPIHSVCPAVDVLFDSVAEAAGNKALGIILTGIGKDGAAGLLKMRQQGSPTIGQDAASSTVYGMPRVAFEIGAVEQQLPLLCIADAICKIVR
ncbi:MAG: hypothetical protein K6F95_01530 [Selenomonas sp.]|uniref:chemotaxis protein CheB n=1 Tax=Selenomonas sp. TaxID=2053611 RepID=UPI0025E5A5D6|nr:chemotaxis protein CheB [Selenomonas sp.]MCR5756574.1 hypothetical protein [Selenomonas sp.]